MICVRINERLSTKLSFLSGHLLYYALKCIHTKTTKPQNHNTEKEYIDFMYCSRIDQKRLGDTAKK